MTYSDLSIGIAVPTLNSGITLDWTLLALTKQQGINVEILVADSGSTDDTLDICKRWNVPHIFVPPGNMYRAINAALKEFTTPWVTYLNSDDLVYPESYSRLVKEGELAGADVVYAKCDFVDAEGRHMYGHIPAEERLLSGLFRLGIMPFSQPASVFRRSTFVDLGGFNENEKTVSDFDFFLRAHVAGRRLVRSMGDSAAAFRVHNAQLSQVARAGIPAEIARVLETSGQSALVWDKLQHWQWRFGNLTELVRWWLRSGRMGRQY